MDVEPDLGITMSDPEGGGDLPIEGTLTGVSWLDGLPGPLVGCWYLDHHWDHDAGDRSSIGQLVYHSKTYGGKPGRPDTARELGGLMAAAVELVRDHGRFPLSEVDIVFPVPAFPPKEPFNLPDVLAVRVRAAIGLDETYMTLHKTRQTPPAKTADVNDVKDAYRYALVLVGNVTGKVVLLVDDVVRSGATLGAIASFLQKRGAAGVGAIAASKADRGMAT